MNCGMGTGLQRGVVSSLAIKQDQLAIRDLLERELELEHQAHGRDRGVGSHDADLLLAPMQPKKLCEHEEWREGR